jgi:hypothetical protein
MKRKMALGLLLALALSACASMRGASVQTDKTTTFSLNVHNARAGTITVSYEDASGTHTLGSVSSGSTERFLLPTGSATVTVRASTSSGTSLTPKTVQVSSGGSTTVTFN